MLGVNIDEVERQQYLKGDLNETQSLQERIVRLAKDCTLAKQVTTMRGYLPKLQLLLASMWRRRHHQQQQQQQQQYTEDQQHAPEQQTVPDNQQTSAAGTSAAAQAGRPVKSLLINLGDFHQSIREVKASSAAAMQHAFRHVLEGDGQEEEHRADQVFSVDQLSSVQRVRSLGIRRDADSVTDTLQGQLSYTNWNKYVFSATWAQKYQHTLLYGIIEGEHLLTHYIQL